MPNWNKAYSAISSFLLRSLVLLNNANFVILIWWELIIWILLGRNYGCWQIRWRWDKAHAPIVSGITAYAQLKTNCNRPPIRRQNLGLENKSPPTKTIPLPLNRARKRPITPDTSRRPSVWISYEVWMRWKRHATWLLRSTTSAEGKEEPTTIER